MRERVFFDEVTPFSADEWRHSYRTRDYKPVAMAMLFLAHLAALAVLVYACSWLPIEDKTAAYLVACTAYLATVVTLTLSDILARVTMMQRELLHAHDDLIGFKHEAREQRRDKGEHR